MKKVFILMMLIAVAFGINAQTQHNNVDPTPHNGEYPQTNLMRAQWDILQEFNTLDVRQAGLATNGTHFFTSDWQNNNFQQYDMDGSNGAQFTIPGVDVGIDEMTYVESTGLFYGVDGHNMKIYAMDLENQTLNSIIPVTCTGVPSLILICYDPQLDGGAGGFWIGDWDELGAVDMNGNELVAGTAHNYDTYGSVYDNWTDPANPKLWLFCQDYVGGDNTMLAEYDINTQSFTGTSYDVVYDSNPYADAGGACSYIRPDGTVALVVVIQINANPNIVREYEFVSPANVSLSPTSHDYGNVSVGASTSQTFTLTNTGGMAAEFENLVISGADASFFDYQNDYFLSIVDIPAGGSVTIDIEYNPTAVGNHTAVATFETSAGDFTANLSGNARIAVTGVSLDMNTATIVRGNTQQLTATVEPDDATNPAVTWSSSDNSIATVSNTGLVTAVAAGSATITVTTADGGFTDDCAVTVTAPVYAIDIDNYDFGVIDLAATATQDFTISNTGDADLVINSMTLSGINAAEFTHNAATPLTVTPGNSHTFTVTFDPAGLGWRYAQVDLVTNDGNHTVTLKGAATSNIPTIPVSNWAVFLAIAALVSVPLIKFVFKR